MASEEIPDTYLIDTYVFPPDNIGEEIEFEHLLQTPQQAMDDMDVKNLALLPFPAMSNVISNEEYPGPYEFEVCIYPVASKQPWVFSNTLNKVYMDMSNPFPIDFKIRDFGLIKEQLYVRATPRYLQAQHLHDLVHRCINHEHTYEPTNREVKDPLHRQHIIRCHNQLTYYVGDKNKRERLSVIFPLATPEPGSDSVKEMYEFVCKNSCPTPGMNRRAIEVIFTLENNMGEILGRRVLNVRICSCPKRDKEKEENEYNKAGNNTVARGKKRKLTLKADKKPLISEATDTTEYDLNLKIVGKQNALKVLEYCKDLMGCEAYKNPFNEDFKKAHSELFHAIGKIE